MRIEHGLARPPGWESVSAALAPLRAGCMGAAGLLLVACVSLAAGTIAGHWLVMGVAFGLFLLVIAYGQLSHIVSTRGSVRAVRLDERADPPALRISYSRTATAVTATWMLLLAVVAAGFGYAGSIYGEPKLEWGGWIGAGLLLLTGAYTTVHAVRPVSEVLLTAATISVVGQEQTPPLPWDELVAVVARVDKGERFLTLETSEWGSSNPTSWRSHMGRKITCEHIPMDPVLLYHLLRHYKENPQDRAELGTPAAIERLHAARYAVSGT
jgi:hypothetical protein